MRKLLILLLCLLPFAGFCVDKNKFKNIPVSRWREVSRMKADSTATPFADTLFIAFKVKDGFSYHNKDGFIYNGTFTVSDDSILDFGTVRYKITEKKPTRLTLANAQGIYVMGIDSTDTVKTIVVPVEEKILPVTDIDQMIGHWTVYKRASDGPTTVDMATQIRSVYITGPSTDGKQGYICGGSDADNNPSWFVKEFGAQALSCGGKTSRTIKVNKCQNGEMILEEDGITYYCKQFK